MAAFPFHVFHSFIFALAFEQPPWIHQQTHDKACGTLLAELPDWIDVAYDGMTFVQDVKSEG